MINTYTDGIDSQNQQQEHRHVSFAQDTHMTEQEETKEPNQGQQQTSTELEQAALDQPREYNPEELEDKQACWEHLERLFEQRVRQFGRLQK